MCHTVRSNFLNTNRAFKIHTSDTQNRKIPAQHKISKGLFLIDRDFKQAANLCQSLALFQFRKKSFHK